MLEIRNLTKRFGGLAAVNDVSTTIEHGKINAIIGPNGAGKTTFFNLVSGVHLPTSGSIHFEGRDVTALRADKMARLGVGRTFQTTALFDQASVLDNLIVGVSAVPEPSSLFLGAIAGLAGIGYAWRRRRASGRPASSPS